MLANDGVNDGESELSVQTLISSIENGCLWLLLFLNKRSFKYKPEIWMWYCRYQKKCELQENMHAVCSFLVKIWSEETCRYYLCINGCGREKEIHALRILPPESAQVRKNIFYSCPNWDALIHFLKKYDSIQYKSWLWWKRLNKNPLKIIITIKCWSFSSFIFKKRMIKFSLIRSGWFSNVILKSILFP